MATEMHSGGAEWLDSGVHMQVSHGGALVRRRGAHVVKEGGGLVASDVFF